MTRFFIDITLFSLALSGLWWLFIPCALFSLFWFERHYETIIAALVIDVLFGAPLWRNAGSIYLFGVCGATLFLILEILKTRLRYYSSF